MGAMAEYFVGPVMEKIINKCFEYLTQTRMKKELQKLRDIHPQIQDVVSSYGQAQIEDLALNKWLWRLRDAVDEADDVIDDILLYRKKHEEQGSPINRKRKADLLEHDIEPNLKRLEEAVQKLYEISARVSTFLHLSESTKQKQQQQQLEMCEARETGSMPGNDLIGRSKEMNFVKQWLRNPCPTEMTNTGFYRNIDVLSVVGHGGMGKTALLQHVYSDRMTEEFDVKIWICVSMNFKAKVVMANMLKFLKRRVSDEETLAALQSSLQSEVMSKRFLLVLDDIWEEDVGKWENVLAPLRYGSSGSKILITTRLDSVASTFAKLIKKSNEILSLNSLEEDECLRLFYTHAFAGVENPNDKFRSIAVKMVEKISGCPLAAKVIGGNLNDYMDECYWEKVLNTNIGDLEVDHNHLLLNLKLSYIHLPKFLQNCFTFCCIFPKHYKFEKDDLVRMWIASGFIQSSNIQEETLEETGRRYFNILVQKSYFEEFCTIDDKICYKMPDLLHEFAQSISTQEIFTVVSGKELSIPPDTIRHVSIISTSRCRGLQATLQKIGKLKKLRTLYLFSFVFEVERIISEIFKALKNIRLLVLSGLELKIPEMIGCLIHLRYLKVESYSWFKLPRCISHLYLLQFLITKTPYICLKELMPNENCQIIMDEFVIEDPSVLLKGPLRSISSIRSLSIEENYELVSFPSEMEQWFLQHSSSLWKLKMRMLKSLQSLPSFESLSS